MMANGPARLDASDRGTGTDDALHRATIALQGRRPQEAERIAGDVLKADPRHVRALHILGSALLMQGRAQDAVAPLEAAQRGRHDPAIETDLAIALRLAGRPNDALWRLKRAVKWRPPYAAAFRELGSLLIAMAQYDEAIEALNRGIEIAPMMPRLSIELGYALLQLRDCVKAEIAFTRALSISPDSPEALFGMAKAHQEVGNNQGAVSYFRRYLVSRPADTNAWLAFGHCLLELGQREAGYDCFRTAARGDPKRYGRVLTSLVASSRGRFWLKPSAAAQYFRGAQA
jgi:Flp pilus assembly protein TadD